MGACGELDSTTENKFIKTRPWKFITEICYYKFNSQQKFIQGWHHSIQSCSFDSPFCIWEKSKHVKKKLDRHFMMTVCHLREKHSTLDDPEVRECPYSTHLCEYVV